MATRIAEAEVLVKVIDKLFTVFQDPRALLDALNDCNCILSGQFVVNLLNPTHMPTVDCVDVLAGDDRFALFAHHLERKERGRVVAHVEDVPDFTPGSYKYAHIFTCAKSTVRVVRSNNNSPFYLVPHYPATHLMNYLTFDHLAVAYPRSRLQAKVCKSQAISTTRSWATSLWTTAPSSATEIRARRRQLVVIVCAGSTMKRVYPLDMVECTNRTGWFIGA
ncbi:hypothetical protein BC629DRAFT_1599659 [Irpex lacteus]|nr:hypothetical protein BC629DRAFT_1599659 [Irpex lacteus]